jgi:hypothetical protein
LATLEEQKTSVERAVSGFLVLSKEAAYFPHREQLHILLTTA